MGSITQAIFINIFRKKSISLFTWADIFKLFNLTPPAAKALLKRLRDRKIIKSLVRGKYMFQLAARAPEDFEIANFIYPPSYVSLESALSLYGILDQFPYQVTSVTLRKTRVFKINGKAFSYAHIRPGLYSGYRKENNCLIADPLKAVFDFLYMVYKGGRSAASLGLLRLEENNLNKERLEAYIEKSMESRDTKFIRFCKNRGMI